MSAPSIIRSLEDVNGFPILDMNADWESRPYQLGDHLHLKIHGPPHFQVLKMLYGQNKFFD